jgi:hypothetical protein
MGQVPLARASPFRAGGAAACLPDDSEGRPKVDDRSKKYAPFGGSSVNRSLDHLSSSRQSGVRRNSTYPHVDRPGTRYARTTDGGFSHLTEAAQIIETTEERLWKPKLHRVRGEVLDATSDRAAAEQAYHQSIAIATQQSSRLEELRASTNLARLWRDQGKRAEARDLLAPVYGWFTEGFDTLDLKQAKALLEELAS